MIKHDPLLTPVELEVQRLQEDETNCHKCRHVCKYSNGIIICDVAMDTGRVMDGLLRCKFYSERD